MTGGVVVRADPGALARLATVGSSVVDRTVAAIRSISDLDGRVRARCGPRVGGEALGSLDRLVDRIAATADLVAVTRRELLAADAPLGAASGTAVSPTGGHALGPVSWPAAQPSPGSPWLDPASDSWVVGLLRTGVEGRPPAALLDRLRADGPDLVADLTDPELSPANQVRLLIGDPSRFAGNWHRVSVGALDGLAAVGASAAGLVSIGTPGLDDSIDRFFGGRPGATIGAAVVDGGRAFLLDPDSLVESAVGWDDYQHDPYYWLGTMLPEVVAEGATAAVPLLPARGAIRVSLDAPSPGSPAAPLARAAGSPEVWSDTPIGGPFPSLDEVRRAEGDWAPAGPITSHRSEPFESPATWVGDLNGDGQHLPGRNNNCVDCARAAEANWRGGDAVAAPLADPDAPGVMPDRLEDWTGGTFVPATIDEIEHRLSELGPGSSAIVTSAWDMGAAHAYNAVNEGGAIRWVDAQRGATSTWPPPYADQVAESIVIFIDADGNPT